MLTHYVIVRRDLPFGVLLAMVAHAAGESFYKKASCTTTVPSTHIAMASGHWLASGPDSSEKEQLIFSQQAAGSSPASGSTFDPSETIAIVLGARNQGRLTKLANALYHDAVPYVEIRESEGEYADQLMAIGIVPGDKAFLAPFVRDFHVLQEATA